jgi:hypothetical protein
MSGRPLQLGDSHNFGRRVALRDERIHKPRTLLWEWLLLSSDSPLRTLLVRAAAADGLGPDAFAFLPTLQFFSPHGAEGGEVERLRLSPLPAPSTELRRELSIVVGRSLALWSWLGVADLHWENLILGVDERERIVFGPLDIEMILAELSLPTETKLLPDADPEYAAICRHASGVRRVLPYLGKPIAVGELLAMVGAYHRSLAFLDRHSHEIAQVFSGLPELHQAPLRVLLRGTSDYVNAASTPLWPPLLEAEAEQLARGDIPYFFRLYGRPGIHYYADATLRQVATLPLHGDVPKLDPILQVSRGLRSPTRKKLRQDGLFTVLGAFDHQSFTGRHESDELSLTFSKRNLVVTFENGEELQTSRNLRAFVGSVYLPCECGEVISVFVPQVSVCSGARSSV